MIQTPLSPHDPKLAAMVHCPFVMDDNGSPCFVGIIIPLIILEKLAAEANIRQVGQPHTEMKENTAR